MRCGHSGGFDRGFSLTPLPADMERSFTRAAGATARSAAADVPADGMSRPDAAVERTTATDSILR